MGSENISQYLKGSQDLSMSIGDGPDFAAFTVGWRRSLIREMLIERGVSPESSDTALTSFGMWGAKQPSVQSED